jgi:hypothetical protein
MVMAVPAVLEYPLELAIGATYELLRPYPNQRMRVAFRRVEAPS